jgi:uncharacterized membrane protein HdeD (DUF308 family)
MTESTQEMMRHASLWSVVWGVLLVLFGMLAVGSPMLAALAVNIFVAWLIILAGIVHLFIAFHSHRASSLVWKALVGAAYVAFGVYLVVHPVLGVVSLTLGLAALFLIEGIFDLVLFFKMRPMPGSACVIFDSIITLLLGLLIGVRWPSSSAWAIGIVVGVSMIVSGVTRIMLSLAVRKVMARA